MSNNLEKLTKELESTLESANDDLPEILNSIVNEEEQVEELIGVISAMNVGIMQSTLAVLNEHEVLAEGVFDFVGEQMFKDLDD